MNPCSAITKKYLHNLMNRRSGVRGAPHRLIPVRPSTRLGVRCFLLILFHYILGQIPQSIQYRTCL